MDADRAVFFDGRLRRPARRSYQTKSAWRFRGATPAGARAPIRFLRGEIEHRAACAAVSASRVAAQLVRIFAAGVSHFVEKRFDGKSRVRMAHRPPPLHGNFVLGTVQIHLQIGDSVKNVGSALDRRLSTPSLIVKFANNVPSMMDWPTMVCVHATGLPLASRPAAKWSYHIGRYHPPRRSSSRVQTTFTGTFAALATSVASVTKSDAGLARRPNPPPSSVVCSVTCSGFRPATLRGSGAIAGLKLRAGPNLAAICVQIHHGVERLHHAVGEVGNFVLGGDCLSRARESRGRVADFFRDGAGSL